MQDLEFKSIWVSTVFFSLILILIIILTLGGAVFSFNLIIYWWKECSSLVISVVFLLCAIAFIAIAVSMAKTIIQGIKYAINFPKYRELFIENNDLESLDDVVRASQGKLGSKQEIKAHLKHYLANKYIIGFRMFSDGTFLPD